MTDRLSLYNGALLQTGSRRLSSVSENVESRRVLDDIWDGGGVNDCLEAGLWAHAMRSMQLDYSPSVEPAYGYTRAFDKPTDLVRLNSLCTDEFYTTPLYDYQDNSGFWFSNYDTLYVQFVSNDASYGMDMSLWPASFTRFVEGHFAERAIKRLTDASVDEDDLIKKVRKLKTAALSHSAQQNPVGFAPQTGWQRARFQSDYGRRRQHPYR